MDSDNRSPIKYRKPKSFKFLHKKDKEEKDKEDKEEKRKGKEGKKEERKKEREKEKEEKQRAKEEKKRNKKDKKKHVDPYVEDSACAVFGVPLCVAVERSPSHDGIRLPVIVRQCIDYIEDHGAQCEGIYRLSGVKSKVQQLRRAYNSAAPVCLDGQDPHVVASLLKQFLRELPEPVLTVDMTAHFEDASQIPGWRDRAEAIRQLLHRLPTPNSTLVHYILTHMGHIIAKESDSKMNYQNVCIVLSPTMRISHRVLNVFFQNHEYLFSNVLIKRYVPPLSSSSEVERMQGLPLLQLEVSRQEAVLAHLHKLLAASPHNTVVQERLWESQRILTLLKRKVKLSQREESEVRGVGEEASSEESQRESVSEATNNSTSIVTTTSDSAAAPPPPPATDSVAAPRDSPSASTDASLLKLTTQDIPKLPKPVSARGERTKIAHNKSSETSVPPVNTKDNSESVKLDHQRRPSEKEENDHVTVISIAESSNAARAVVSSTAQEDISLSSIAADGHKASSAVRSKADDCKPATVSSAASLAGNLTTTAAQNTMETLMQPICVDAELVSLVREEAQHLAHHAELLAMNHDLSRKLHAERVEIVRLKEEIQEVQTLYGYRTYSYDSSESGGESESGGAAGDSDTEEELLQQLHALQYHNSSLQRNNGELIQRIQEEREAVVLLRARLRQTHALTTQPLPAPAPIVVGQ